MRQSGLISNRTIERIEMLHVAILSLVGAPCRVGLEARVAGQPFSVRVLRSRATSQPGQIWKDLSRNEGNFLVCRSLCDGPGLGGAYPDWWHRTNSDANYWTEATCQHARHQPSVCPSIHSTASSAEVSAVILIKCVPWIHRCSASRSEDRQRERCLECTFVLKEVVSSSHNSASATSCRWQNKTFLSCTCGWTTHHVQVSWIS